MRMPLSSPLSFAIVPFNGSLSTAREPRSIVKSFEHETNVFVTSKYHLEEMGRSGGKGKGARKRERLEDKERTGEKSLVPGMDVSVKERGRSIKSSETRRIKGRMTVCSEGWSIGGGGWFHRKVWMETTWNRITAMIANNRFSWIGRERNSAYARPFPTGRRMTKLYLSAFFASRSLSTCFFRDVAKFGKQPSGHPGRWILDNDAIENREDYVPKRYNF